MMDLDKYLGMSIGWQIAFASLYLLLAVCVIFLLMVFTEKPREKLLEKFYQWRTKKKVIKNNLPFCKVQDGCGACQAYCPNCKYGEGTIDNFISGAAKPFVQTCKTCGSKYNSLGIPKDGWNINL